MLASYPFFSLAQSILIACKATGRPVSNAHSSPAALSTRTHACSVYFTIASALLYSSKAFCFARSWNLKSLIADHRDRHSPRALAVHICGRARCSEIAARVTRRKEKSVTEFSRVARRAAINSVFVPIFYVCSSGIYTHVPMQLLFLRRLNSLM
jgi:hypothetical protein